MVCKAIDLFWILSRRYYDSRRTGWILWCQTPARLLLHRSAYRRENFSLPEEIKYISRDKPWYIRNGKLGNTGNCGKIIESFEGKPYRVIAPVKFHLDKVRGWRFPPMWSWRIGCPPTRSTKMVDISVIHGGIGTVMTAAYAGKPVVGVGMQPEQDAILPAW